MYVFWPLSQWDPQLCFGGQPSSVKQSLYAQWHFIHPDACVQTHMTVIHPDGVWGPTRHAQTHTDAHRRWLEYGNNGWGLIPSNGRHVYHLCSAVKPFTSPRLSIQVSQLCRKAPTSWGTLPSLKVLCLRLLIINGETNWAHPCRRCSRLFARRTHFLRRWGRYCFSSSNCEILLSPFQSCHHLTNGVSICSPWEVNEAFKQGGGKGDRWKRLIDFLRCFTYTLLAPLTCELICVWMTWLYHNYCCNVWLVENGVCK